MNTQSDRWQKRRGKRSSRLASSEFPKAPMLGSEPKIQNPLGINFADGFTGEVSNDKPVSDLLHMLPWDAEEVAKARKTGKPKVQR